ncbi:conserved oligomeric Golgi complex subunit 5 [Culicoides brevitarsis]|uniref:conserved oligomeric Golgi complex subunit 5 n=1 Tax=Culicoides brevitarsis TaxID=469753 RepID=UPI00307B9DA8
MSSDVCETIENDEFFRHFLKEESKKEELLLSFTEQISKLSEGLELISSELQTQVKDHHGSLLKQAANQRNLHESLDKISSQMELLEAAGSKLREKVTSPHQILENQTRVLRNLHEASHLLRQVSRFLKLHSQLFASTDDLAQQAKILHELEPLMDDEELKKITFLQEERASIVTKRQKLLLIINRDLTNGLENNKIETITTNLQIFSNLHMLKSVLDQTRETFIDDIKHSIKAAFAGTDVKTLRGGEKSDKNAEKRAGKGPGKTPTLTTSQHFRTKLWNALEWLYEEEIYEILQQVALLSRAVEHVNTEFQDRITAEDVRKQFWHDLEALLKKSFGSEAPPHVGQCLCHGLPKLLSSARSLELKLNDEFKFSKSIFGFLEAGYLEKCGLNLKASMNGVDQPNQEVVDAMIRNASTELSAAIVDENLLLLVSSAVNACNKDFWTKTEAFIKLGADSKQVFDIPNTAQVQNRDLANTIHYHQVATIQMVNDLGPKFATTDAAKKIIDGLQVGRTLILTILQQLMESMNAAVNIILLSMHREPGLNTQNIATSGPSLYMKELIDFIARIWNSHIVPFSDKLSVDQCGRELAKNCIDLFITNIAVVRPLSNAGRQRLKNDCAHLEKALKPVTPDLAILGKQFRLLRSISYMITQTPENLIQNTAEEGIVSPYLVLFLLFGHAKQQELASPHQAADWSNERLIQWLDGHTNDKERLDLIYGALQKYRLVVQKKNIATYDPVYPIIMSYFEKVVK